MDQAWMLPAEVLLDWGAYLQGTWGFKLRWVAGLRVDWADSDGNNKMDPLRDFRLQYNWDRADHLDRDESSLFFQFEFLYGAHGGDKF